MFVCLKDMRLAEVGSIISQATTKITSSQDQDITTTFNLKITNSNYHQHVTLSTNQPGENMKDFLDYKFHN